MRITFLVPRCTPDNSHGRYVIELSRRLSRHNTVVVHSGSFSEPPTPSMKHRFLPIPDRPAIARLASLWVTAPLTTKRLSGDVVHIQGADAPVGNVVTAHCCNAAMRTLAAHEPSF